MGRRISYPTVLSLNLPSCAILAVESRVCDPASFRVLSDTYNKLIQLLPNTYLGCFGDCNVIDQVVDDALSNLPTKPHLVGEIAVFVQNTINAVLENYPPIEDEDEDDDYGRARATRFVLLGRCINDSRHYFYTITKGSNNNRMYFARREKGNVVLAGYRSVIAFLNHNQLDENMTEDEAVDYGFRCMRHSAEGSLVSGGIIQVAAMRPEPQGCSILHSWKQENPMFCLAPYYYQEPRISRGY